MRSICIEEARIRFGALLALAEAGDAIAIAREGKAVARISAVPWQLELPDLTQMRDIEQDRRVGVSRRRQTGSADLQVRSCGRCRARSCSGIAAAEPADQEVRAPEPPMPKSGWRGGATFAR